MCTGCYLGLGFSFLRNSLCLMVVTWMLAEYDLTVVHLFKCIFNLGPSATLSWHCTWAIFGVRVRLLAWIKGVAAWERCSHTSFFSTTPLHVTNACEKVGMRRSSLRGNGVSRNNFAWSTWTPSCLQKFRGAIARFARSWFRPCL